MGRMSCSTNKVNSATSLRHQRPPMWNGGSPLAITGAVSDSRKLVDLFAALVARVV